MRRLLDSVLVASLWACLPGCGSTSGDPLADPGSGGAAAGGSSAGGVAGSAGEGAGGNEAGGAAGNPSGETGGAATGGAATGGAAGSPSGGAGGTGGTATGGAAGSAVGGSGGTAGGGLTSLLVYDANVENLETPNDACPGDWKDLFAFMKVQGDSPDVFLVQQISDQAELDVLIAHLKTPSARAMPE